MPSKEQKKLNRREENEKQQVMEQQHEKVEKEWENGTDKRGNMRKQEKDEKQAYKMQKKLEKQDLLEQEDALYGNKK